MTDYAWPGGRRSAACFSVDVDAESPYLWQHRKGLPRTIATVEARRFGVRTGLWRLLDMLDRVKVRGSFFVPGVVADLHPEVLPALVERGHEVGLHGWLHELVAETDIDTFRRALDRSLALFEAQTGRPPRGFRSPAWEMTAEMIAALKDRDIAWDSSLSGFDHPYEIDGITEVPIQWLTDDAIYFKFMGGGADKWPPVPARQIGEAWRDEWDAGRHYGALFMQTVHPWISGRASRVAMLERLWEEIAEAGDVWIATAGQIADWHAETGHVGHRPVSADLRPLEARL
ncbi:polysaccharide deacetylase family protein [Roseivivax isoporae]|uniref:Chitooligosaccharide deacetylase n=1 Tax=Roseivivax isoporae LMG 25204 TaxID=1449351 RepID=X7FCR8_9RHOB|nr:polysaccharide deacetylase [Roseivivax isoporae]ETX29896.1 polysaccharide deacetylase [Roseivivax isoporae LMG 25204]